MIIYYDFGIPFLRASFAFYSILDSDLIFYCCECTVNPSLLQGVQKAVFKVKNSWLDK